MVDSMREVSLLASASTLVVMIAIASPAAAQGSAPQASTGQAGSTQSADQAPAASQGLEDIIVTAQRRAQSLSKVPVSIQAVTEQQLKIQVLEDTPSLVKASPSVAFTGGFSANSSGFVIRGITSASSEGGLQQSTAMVIDGVPLARPGEFLGDLGDIERVEILRGPQGTLFGKNATAGVVSIVTQRPTNKYEGYVEGSAATGGEYLGRAMLNIPLRDTVRVRVNGYYASLEPLVDNLSTGGDVYGYKRYGFSGKLDFDLGSAVTLKLSGDYRRGDSTFGQALNVVPSTGIGPLQIAAIGFTPRRGLVRNATDGKSFDRSEGYSFTGELGWDLADRLKLTAISGYRDFKDDNQSDVDNTPAGFVAGRGFSPNPARYPVMYVDIASANQPRQPQHVSYFSQEIRFNYTGDRLNAVGGVFYQTLKDRGAGITPFIFDGAFVLRDPTLAGVYLYNATSLNYHIDDDTYAAFGDVTFKLTDMFSLFGGLRYTHEKIDLHYANVSYFGAVAANYGAIILPGPNGQPAISIATGAPNLAPIGRLDFNQSKSTNNLSGRAGIQFQPSSTTNFYASYNRGYKGPAADVSRGAAAPNPTTGYSPLLKPEIATSYELGAKVQLLDNNVQLSVNLFREKVKDVQQAIVLPSTVTQLINAGDIKSDGVEFEGRARVFRGFTIDGGVTYDDARYSGDVFVGCYPQQTVGCVNKRQSLDGKRTVNSYKWRYSVAGTYTTPLDSHDMDLTFRVGWQWFGSSPQRLDTDPLLNEPSHGLLDASVTLAGQNGKWSIQAFGKNLTNDFYYAGLVNVDNTISRVSGYLNRDYQRYGGLKLRVGF